MIQIILIFIALVIIHALENKIRIDLRNKRHDYRKLHHTTEAIKYIVASIIVSLFGYFYYEFAIWELVFLAWFTRGAFFNISINLFRKLIKIDYENPDSGSNWDWISRFLPFWHKQIIFTSLWIIIILAITQNG